MDASNPLYRMFAVDESRDILYFCDETPHDNEGKVCFSSNQYMDEFSWTELPRFVKSIDGYDKTNELVFFNGGQFYSSDGVKFIENKDHAEIAADIVVPPVAVPGVDKLKLDVNTNLAWTGTSDIKYKGWRV